MIRATQVYLDANFLVALSRPAHIWHANAQALQTALQERQVKLNLSALAFNEAIYQLVRLAQRDEAGNAYAPDEALFGAGETKNYAPALTRLDETVLNLPGLQFFEPPNAKMHRRVLRAISELELDPTDAFHYEAAHRLNCPLVSNDVQFQRVPDPNLTIITFF